MYIPISYTIEVKIISKSPVYYLQIVRSMNDI